jgi:hypothetical protein
VDEPADVGDDVLDMAAECLDGALGGIRVLVDEQPGRLELVDDTAE